MNEEKTTLTSESANEENAGTEFDPVQALKELKANSVPKSEYDKACADRDKYLKAIFEGGEAPESEKEPVDIDALRKELFGGEKDLSNLEYAQKALQLRNELIDQQGIDIFVGRGSKFTPTNEDYESAQRLADGLEHCIEVAEGDTEIFTRELMRMTDDVSVSPKINPKIRR